MKWYIGVDPGLSGGLGLVDGAGKAVEYERMPDIAGINQFFRNAIVASRGNLAVVYEEHKGGGADTNADAHRSAGRFIGIFETMCCIHGVPMNKVTPQVWKAEFGLIQRTAKKPAVKKVKGEKPRKPTEAEKKVMVEEKRKKLVETRKAAKVASCRKAKELCPNINLVFPRCTNEHDGTAEGLLLALFGLRRKL